MDEQAALAELTQATEPQAETVTPEQAQAIQEYYELPYNNTKLQLPLDHPFPMKHNGAIQNVPLSKMMNVYRQSEHMESKQKKFKEEMQGFQQKAQQFGEWEQLYPKYKEFDDWASKNPQEWERLYSFYQNKDAYLGQGEKLEIGPDHPVMKQFSTLSSTIQELQGKLSKYENFMQEDELNKARTEVNGEIDTFKKEFSQIDLDEQDLDGVSLRGQILKFAEDHQYPTFRAAALDYKYSDGTPLLSKLLDTAQREGRNAAVKTVKQDTKNGVVARSSTPFGQSNNVDPRRMKTSDRDELALAELTQLLKR